MFDPYAVAEGTIVETDRLDAFQLNDARLKLGRRGLNLQILSTGKGKIVKLGI